MAERHVKQRTLEQALIKNGVDQGEAREESIALAGRNLPTGEAVLLAIENIRKRHVASFDADVRQQLAVITRLLDEFVKRPGSARTEQVMRSLQDQLEPIWAYLQEELNLQLRHEERMRGGP